MKQSFTDVNSLNSKPSKARFLVQTEASALSLKSKTEKEVLFLQTLIKNEKLNVERIYTAWPLNGQKEYVTVDLLKKLVETK